MKITTINNTTSTSTTKKKQSVSGGGSFASHLNESTEASANSGVGAVNSVNSLFMLQEVENEGPARNKAIKHGDDILDHLDKIKLSLLDSSISPNLIRNLDNLIKQWRENLNDPELQSIIDEIELRAAVELAKLNRG